MSNGAVGRLGAGFFLYEEKALKREASERGALGRKPQRFERDLYSWRRRGGGAGFGLWEGRCEESPLRDVTWGGGSKRED